MSIRGRVKPSLPQIDYHRVNNINMDNENQLRIEDMTSRDHAEDYYSSYRFHEEMLKDPSYFRCYRSAICYNKHLIKDKVS